MKNIVVTGANKGLGLEFTRQLSKDNHVIATARNISSEHELHLLPNVKIKKLDLLSDATIDQFVEDISDTPIDILINNAGIFHEEQFEGLDPNIWLDEMKINALSPISLTHKLMKNLQAGSSKKVIFLSSQMGSI
ncbi:MAG: SDR family NAD(P)-dependent oxidoreductase, partial [Candidatus Pelagibacter sp. TMED239]